MILVAGRHTPATPGHRQNTTEGLPDQSTGKETGRDRGVAAPFGGEEGLLQAIPAGYKYIQAN